MIIEHLTIEGVARLARFAIVARAFFEFARGAADHFDIRRVNVDVEAAIGSVHVAFLEARPSRQDNIGAARAFVNFVVLNKLRL